MTTNKKIHALMRALLLGLTLCLTGIHAWAQNPRLLKDMHCDPMTAPLNSDPHSYVEMGSNLYFSSTAWGSRDLWVTDGVTASFVKDMDPLYGVEMHDPILVLQDRLYFKASSNLWVSDGSDQGTFQLKDLLPSPKWYPSSSSTWLLDVVNGKLFFTAVPIEEAYAGNLPELFVTSGTAQSTYKVKELFPPTGSYGISKYLAWNGFLYFGARDEVNQGGLWRTDGTDAGTWLIKDLSPSGYTTFLRIMEFQNEMLLFVTVSGNQQVWRSDGTPAGTVLVSELFGSWYGEFSAVTLGDHVVFSGSDATCGKELWITDGTSAGTQLVMDIRPGQYGSSIEQMVATSEAVFFVAFDPDHGRELWVSDGTPAGTHLVADLTPGTDYTYFEGLVVFQDQCYFFARGHQFWHSDGTEAGTTMIKDFRLEDDSGEISAWGIGLGKLWMTAPDEDFVFQPWTYDGTNMDLFQGFPNNANPSTTIRGYTMYDGALWLAACEEASSTVSIWRSEGMDWNTQVVMEDAHVFGMSAVNGMLFMNRDLGGDAESLWVTSGSLDDLTELVADLGNDGSVVGFHPFHDRMLFNVGDGSNMGRLWVSDGTVDGTQRIADRGFSGNDAAILEDRVIYISGDELRVTDGTEEGSVVLKSFYGYCDGPLIQADDLFFFAGHEQATGLELWVTDGTEPGTRLVKDLYPGSYGSYPEMLGEFDGKAWFERDEVLWCSDGTAAGTRAAVSMGGGTMTAMWNSGRGYFIARVTGENRRIELWRSDGTMGNTFMLADLSHVGDWGAMDDRLFFSAYDSEHGVELWQCDGTIAGTHLTADIAPGIESSWPEAFFRLDHQLFFRARAADQGRELWVLCTPPDATINVDPVLCQGGVDKVAWVEYPGLGAEYQWQVAGASLTSIANGQSITFQPDGSPEIVLDVTVHTAGNCHESGQSTCQVVSTVPEAPAGIQGDAEFCALAWGYIYSVDPVDLANSYEWSVPAGAVVLSGQGTPLVEVQFGDAEGNVSVIAVNDCGASAPCNLPVALASITNQANAGPDQDACGSSTTLQGNEPLQRSSGLWIIESGVGGVLHDPTNPHTTFDGLSDETYRLSWTIDDGPCGMSTDEVYVHFALPPSPAQAGPDQLVCGYQVTLAATQPQIGVGHWEAIDPPTSCYFDAYDPDTTFRGGGNNDYVLHWIVESGDCVPEVDEVIIGLRATPTNFTAGEDQLNSIDIPAQLHATLSDPWTGTWSVQSGPNMSPAQFGDVTDPITTFTPAGGTGTYSLIWTVTNEPCAPRTDSVTLRFVEDWRRPIPVVDNHGEEVILWGQDSLELSGEVLFRGSQPSTDTELWKTDGTDQGTVLVKDINPFGSSMPYSFIRVGDVVFFEANDGVHGNELWRTDGTESGTTMVKDIYPGAETSNMGIFHVKDNLLIFAADDGVHGYELWRSDGTEAGTTMVVDLVPGSLGSATRSSAIMNGFVYFRASEYMGNALWRTDGTEAGTQLVNDMDEVLDYSIFAALNNDILFVKAYTDAYGYELWALNSTGSAPWLLKDIDPGPQSCVLYDKQALGDKLVFQASESNSSTGGSLWVSDGTAVGTQLLLTNYSQKLIPYQNGLMFLTSAGIYWTDGTASGTYMMTSLEGYPGDPFMVLHHGKAYFNLNTDEWGEEPYRTDFTQAGTELICDIVEGSYPSNPYFKYSAGDRVYFAVTYPESKSFYFNHPASSACAVLGPDWVCSGAAGLAVLGDLPAGTTVQWAVTNGSIVAGGDTPTLEFSVGTQGVTVLSAHLTAADGAVQSLHRSVGISAFDGSGWHAGYRPDQDRDGNQQVDVRDGVEHFNQCGSP